MQLWTEFIRIMIRLERFCYLWEDIEALFDSLAPLSRVYMSNIEREKEAYGVTNYRVPVCEKELKKVSLTYIRYTQ